MTIDSMWIQVSCDQCGKELEVELETDFRKESSWPTNTDRLYAHLVGAGWNWKDGRAICPTCDGPTKEDIADYKAYHAGEGIHTP